MLCLLTELIYLTSSKEFARFKLKPQRCIRNSDSATKWGARDFTVKWYANEIFIIRAPSDDVKPDLIVPLMRGNI